MTKSKRQFTAEVKYSILQEAEREGLCGSGIGFHYRAHPGPRAKKASTHTQQGEIMITNDPMVADIL